MDEVEAVEVELAEEESELEGAGVLWLGDDDDDTGLEEEDELLKVTLELSLLESSDDEVLCWDDAALLEVGKEVLEQFWAYCVLSTRLLSVSVVYWVTVWLESVIVSTIVAEYSVSVAVEAGGGVDVSVTTCVLVYTVSVEVDDGWGESVTVTKSVPVVCVT